MMETKLHQSLLDMMKIVFEKNFLAIHPDFQSLGLGKLLMFNVEKTQ